jgi:hypothetical protein
MSDIDMDLISDECWKQSAELEKKLRIRQKRLEDLNATAVEKESFSDGQKLVKSEVELHLVVKVKHLTDEACELLYRLRLKIVWMFYCRLKS